MADFEWYGPQVEKKIISALGSGVGKSIAAVKKDTESTIPIDTGRARSEVKSTTPKRDGDGIYSIVKIDVSYGIFIELKNKTLRRALMKNENSSLKNFDGTLK